ncbi:hypothetical protein [Corynebacterium afermentans]|uniref:hypothetical protein n=1 Tax=Corynebacterium afermentans TaxID=38286 RepID=UPI001177A7DE|nr:hypothetical protein [Corynebacterium afermentans]MDC7109588.1 hypothetical protein [Corynebacterium afermentans]
MHEGYDITGAEQPFEFEVAMDGELGNGGPDWTPTHEDGSERGCSAVVFFLARGRRRAIRACNLPYAGDLWPIEGAV